VQVEVAQERARASPPTVSCGPDTAIFDEPNLVPASGLIPVMRLAG
jgi:hypothetical protein